MNDHTHTDREQQNVLHLESVDDLPETLAGPLFRIYPDRKDGQPIFFEWHRNKRPLPVNNKDGEPRNFHARHWFWKAIGEWVKRGRPVTHVDKNLYEALWTDSDRGALNDH